jgi:hypothetical protein
MGKINVNDDVTTHINHHRHPISKSSLAVMPIVNAMMQAIARCDPWIDFGNVCTPT